MDVFFLMKFTTYILTSLAGVVVVVVVYSSIILSVSTFIMIIGIMRFDFFTLFGHFFTQSII